MLSDLVDDELLSGSATLPVSTKPMVNMTNTSSSNSGGGSVVLMQPKLEPQPVVFDQQQQSKMVPIAPRYDSQQQCSTIGSAYTCSHCTQPIHERYLLYTQDRLCRGNYWHMQCLRCQCCDAVLADISSTFYIKDNALLCKSDYIKRYGSRPCSLCSQVIGPNEQVMRVSPNYVYHLHCFTCIKCHARLVKGDRYVFFNGQLYCEKDNPLKSTTNTSNSPVSKRGTTTSKRGAKAATAAASRAAAAAAAAAQAQQQTFVTPSPPIHHQYHPPTHTGHLTLLNNHHIHSSPSPSTSTITHSLLNNNNNTNSNGLSSLATPSGDELC
ncbi:unnamed protein product [Adineta steineri]|uniref:LIM zinc-binding domain-containing protein n=1 Tax=Adineta steineri TaxID=433720 RepID=A0A819DJ44_9BILA|nr:unnamed protein product [Adineta steineri]CAF3560829.1 unnamed protein product [Adineta steineri]CAF3835391.1 unnamed protein product [Adineta steineri]